MTFSGCPTTELLHINLVQFGSPVSSKISDDLIRFFAAFAIETPLRGRAHLCA